jgi:hypothetical protein
MEDYCVVDLEVGQGAVCLGVSMVMEGKRRLPSLLGISLEA